MLTKDLIRIRVRHVKPWTSIFVQSASGVTGWGCATVEPRFSEVLGELLP